MNCAVLKKTGQPLLGEVLHMERVFVLKGPRKHMPVAGIRGDTKKRKVPIKGCVVKIIPQGPIKLNLVKGVEVVGPR